MINTDYSQTDFVLHSQRLDLVPMTLEFIEAVLAHDLQAASRSGGFIIPPDFDAQASVLKWRQRQLRANPGAERWLLRSIVLRETRSAVGRIGFHSKPDSKDTQRQAPNSLELGYAIFPSFRRQGFAKEAAITLMRWAHVECGIQKFLVSISPNNKPSLSLAQSLGFERVNSRPDRGDGRDNVYVLHWPNNAA